MKVEAEVGRLIANWGWIEWIRWMDLSRWFTKKWRDPEDIIDVDLTPL